MKLYYFPLSSYSQKVLFALYEKEIPFEPEIVDLLDPVARKAYRETYPIGKVPLLIRDDRVPMGESSVIIEYLHIHHPGGPALLPADPEQALRVRALDRWFDLYVNDPATRLLIEGMKPEDKRDANTMKSATAMLDKMYPILDKHVAKREWAAGNDLTLADCAAGPALAYCRQVHPFESFENLDRYFGHLRARPSFHRVLEEAGAWAAKR